MQEQIDFNKDQVADLKIDSSVFEQKIISIDHDLGAVNEAVMMNTQFTTELHFSLKEEVADRKAEIFRIEQVQVTDREAAARWQEQITAKVDFNASEILNIKDAQATYEKATAQQISQVKADLGETNKEVGNIKGRVTTVETATADLKQAQAKFEQSTTAEFGEMRGYITNIETSLTNIEFAVSEAIMQTTAQVNETNSELLKTKAEVTRLATATATNEKATAQLVESVKAQHDQSEAEFIDVRKSIAEKDKAHSERTEQVRAELGKDINANKEGIDKNKGELSKVSAAVTNNTQSIATLEETTTQIKQTQQSQYDDTQASIGKLTETTASNTKAITEVKEQSQSRFESNEAVISSIQRTQSDDAASQAETTMQLSAQQYDQSTQLLRAQASITKLENVVADEFHAYAQDVTQLKAQFGETQAAIEQMAKVEVDHQGNASSIFSIKNAVMVNGQYYEAQMMIGAIVKNGQVTTQIGFSADTFGIFNPSSGKLEPVFFVENGQVFMNEAFINKAYIEKLLVGMEIRSKKYEKGKVGYRLDAETGSAEFNKLEVYGDFKISGDAGKILLDATGLMVYDQDGRWAVKLGRRP
ncbi:DUF1983 domain-containing protein [Providencia manganoxydans]